MAENSKIEWTDSTFNPWRGCQKVSTGCANCYAEAMSGRNPAVLGEWGPQGTRVVAAESAWREPLKWDRQAKLAAEMFEAIGGDPSRTGQIEYQGTVCRYNGRPRVFCASLADVFEAWDGPMMSGGKQPVILGRDYRASSGPESRLTMDDVRRRLFDTIDATPNLDWLLVTKRPENIARMMPGRYWVKKPCSAHAERFNLECPACNAKSAKIVLPVRPNLWLGASVEDRKHGLPRIDVLRTTPAAVRFLSVEPLLEDLGTLDLTGIHWVIVGGESGHDARKFQLEWARRIVSDCREAGVPCFVKQVGTNPWDDLTPHLDDRLLTPLTMRDKKGGDWSEWPEDLRVRQFPEVSHA